jgi:hypothetical protein
MKSFWREKKNLNGKKLGWAPVSVGKKQATREPILHTIAVYSAAAVKIIILRNDGKKFIWIL